MDSNEMKPKSNVLKRIKDFGFANIYSKYGTILIFISIFIIAAIASPVFLKPANLTNVVRQLVVVTLLGLGETFIIILGHIDVSVGSVVALTGSAACLVMSATQSIFLAVLTGIVVGIIVGLVNGFVITKFGIPAFIMTLAMAAIARGVVLIITKGIPVTHLGNFNFIGQGSIGFIPVPIIILFIFIGISWVALNRLQFGRHIFAIGGNMSAAVASGIKVKKVVIMAFVLNGILAATAGIILMSRINSGQPAAGVGYEFDAITAVVIGGTSLMGGRGGIIGTFIGALIIGVINNMLNLLNVSSFWQQVARGLIVVIAVILDVKTKRKTD